MQGPGMGTRGGCGAGEGVGDFSLDFGGNEVDLLAALVYHNRIVGGPRIRAQNDPVLGRERGRWLSSCPIPQQPPQPPPPSPKSLLTRNTRPAMVVPVLCA